MENIQSIINFAILVIAMAALWRSNRLIKRYRKFVDDHTKLLTGPGISLKSEISVKRPELGVPSDDPTIHAYMVKHLGPFYYYTAEQRYERWNRLFRFKRSVRKLKKVPKKRRAKPFPSHR